MSQPARPLQSPLALATAAGLTFGNLFLHKPISDVCDAVYAAIGRASYERLSLAAIGAGSLLAALPGARRRLRDLAGARRAAALIATVLLSAAAQRWLLVSNIELVHFPQFALIAALLVASGAPPWVAWLGATAAGVLDEAYQHLVIYRGVAGTYFDYNDIVLDAIGATWGVLLFAAGALRIPAAARRGAARWIGAALLGALLAAAFLYRPPRLTPLLVLAATGRPYRVLTPGEGLLGVLAAAGLVLVAAARPRAREAGA